MTTKELQQLIQHPQEENIAFKRDLNVQQEELIEEILLLAKRTVQSHQTGYLIIGVEKLSKTFYHVGEVDAEGLATQLIQSGIARSPAFPEIHCEAVEVEGKRILVIMIPSAKEANEESKRTGINIEQVQGDISHSTLFGGDVKVDGDLKVEGDLKQTIVITEPSRQKPVYEIALTHNFDLENLIDPCVNTLWKKCGLIGFAVPYNSPTFLTNFSEGLKRQLRKNIEVQGNIEIASIHTPLDDALDQISLRYLPALKNSDVLLLVRFLENVATPFWQRLRSKCNGDSANCLITILALSPDFDCPPEVVQLCRPQFKIVNLKKWIGNVVDSFDWPNEMIEQWVELVETKCRDNGNLKIEWVYFYLEASIDILKHKPTPEEFLKELKSRR